MSIKKEDIQYLVNKVREMRKEQKISQADMAAKLGISQNSYSRIEMGETEVKAVQLFTMLDAVGIDIMDGFKKNNSGQLVALEPEQIITLFNKQADSIEKQAGSIEDIKADIEEIKKLLKKK